MSPNLLLASVVVWSTISAEPPIESAGEKPTPPSSAVVQVDPNYTRLLETVNAFAAIVDRVNEKHGRQTFPSLYVDFGIAIALEDNEDEREIIAPRADFLRLADLAHEEATRSGILDAAAEIARSSAVAFPIPPHFDKPELNYAGLNRLFGYIRFAAHRAADKNDPPAAARHLASYAGLASLWCEEPAMGRAAGPSTAERLVYPAMPLIVEGKFNRESRRLLATALRDHRVDPIRRVREYRDTRVREIREIWASLPKELFEPGDTASTGWDALDPRTQLFVESVVTTRNRVVSEIFGSAAPRITFPIPTHDSLIVEYDAAIGWVLERERSPIGDRRDAVWLLEKSASSPSEARIASAALTYERVLRTERTRRLASEAIRVAIALEDYRDAEGRYPETLADLVPKHLDAIPEDPALPGSPILYRREPITTEGKTFQYRLYSRGRNAIDDGGMPATWKCGIDLLYHDIERPTDILLNAVR